MSHEPWPQGPREDSVERISQHLRLRREQAGLSIRQLASRAHYSHATIHAAELDKSAPTVDVVRAYVRATGGTAEEEAAWADRLSAFREQPKTSTRVSHLPN